MTFNYLKHSDIDKALWDQTVVEAPNGLVYGMSWYLDIVCPNWDALVTDGYKVVLPLPWKKKFGLKYIYQPWFAQQLGVFGKDTESIVWGNVLKSIPGKFIRYEFSFNHANTFAKALGQSRQNYLLPLNREYPALVRNYNENTRRNLKKAQKLVLSLDRGVAINEFIQFKWVHMETKMNENQREFYRKLLEQLIYRKVGQLVGVRDTSGTLLGTVCWVCFKKRITYLSAVSSPMGKELRVMTLLVDDLIHRYAGQDKIIDFEGSMLEGVARFYKGFGAIAEPYFRQHGTMIHRFTH